MTQQQNEDYRMKYLEEKVNGHEERIRGLEVLGKEMTKISTILEHQQEMNKKQDETLSKINDNLTNLNYKSDRLAERVDGLEIEVKEQVEKDKISLILSIRKYGGIALGVVVTTIVTFILRYFGIF